MSLISALKSLDPLKQPDLQNQQKLDEIIPPPSQAAEDKEGIPHNKESLESLWRLLKILMVNLNFEDVVDKVVNSVLDELGYMNLGYRIIVLSLVDQKAGGLRRIALSETKEAKQATSVSTIPFEKIIIPFSASNNYCVKVLIEKKPLVTTSWPDLLCPPLTPEAALTNQRASGIKTSMVYPVFSQNRPIGSLIFSMVKNYDQVTDEEKDLLTGFADLVGLAVQNSLLYTSLDNTSRQLRVANAKLEELDRLKDDFVSVASHELRTPMTAIRAYAWMALNRADISLSEKMKLYLGRTLISTERLINLVNEMLNISRIESGQIEVKPQAFKILDIVKEVVEEVSLKAQEKKLKLKINEQVLPPVFADKDKVHQILLNLIGNSLKFTPQDGEIEIFFAANNLVLGVAIKDNGSGVSKDDTSRLFKKFGRLDSSYVTAGTSGGTGLGLYICKSLVELMGGEIWVESLGIGKGSTFYFTLPIASQEVLAHPEKYQFKPQGEAKGLEPVEI